MRANWDNKGEGGGSVVEGTLCLRLGLIPAPHKKGGGGDCSGFCFTQSKQCNNNSNSGPPVLILDL